MSGGGTHEIYSREPATEKFPSRASNGAITGEHTSATVEKIVFEVCIKCRVVAALLSDWPQISQLNQGVWVNCWTEAWTTKCCHIE